MKKYISYILLILLSFSFALNTYAAECGQTCSISDAPAPALTEYFKNVEKATSNILEALSEAEPTESNNKDQEKSRVLASLTSILSFGDFFGSFDFKISLPITNEVPKEVKRDHSRIERETEKLTRILETAEKRNTAGSVVENICSGVSNCNISGKTARNQLTQLIKNNDAIAQLYRSSILDKPFLTQQESYILVAPDFVGQIQKHYNKDTLTACSSCEGGFTDTIREKIQNIGSLQSNAKDGIQKWKDAWNLIRGGKATPGYAEKEATLLAGYLSSQGVESEQAGVIMGNLNRYNGGGLSSSNPLDNSAYHAQAQVEAEVKTFREAILEKMDDNKIPLAEITRVDTQIKQSEDIKDEVAALYEDQLPFAFAQDTGAQILQGRIIRMHFSLVNSINILGGQVKSAEKLCEKQDTGNGKCDGYE